MQKRVKDIYASDNNKLEAGFEPDDRQIVLRGFENLVGVKRKTTSKLRDLRLERMMSKSELARKAGISPITITRIENGLPARLETKRKILEALGLSFTDRFEVFGDDFDNE